MPSTVHLVDASMYVFRAWHSLPDEFQDHEGWPVNAVHGFTRFVLELGPFGGSHQAGTTLLVWSAAYLALVLLLALFAFSRRDL